MSRDGRYATRSHGWRCGYGKGWTVCHKEPRMAVWLWQGMEGMPQGAMEGGVAMSMDGQSYITSSHGRKIVWLMRLSFVAK